MHTLSPHYTSWRTALGLTFCHITTTNKQTLTYTVYIIIFTDSHFIYIYIEREREREGKKVYTYPVFAVHLPQRVRGEKTEGRNGCNPPLHHRGLSAPLDLQQLQLAHRHCSSLGELKDKNTRHILMLELYLAERKKLCFFLYSHPTWWREVAMKQHTSTRRSLQFFTKQ